MDKDQLIVSHKLSDEKVIFEAKRTLDDPKVFRGIDPIRVYRADTYFGEFHRDGSYVLNTDESIKYADSLDLGIHCLLYTSPSPRD